MDSDLARKLERAAALRAAILQRYQCMRSRYTASLEVMAQMNGANVFVRVIANADQKLERAAAFWARITDGMSADENSDLSSA